MHIYHVPSIDRFIVNMIGYKVLLFSYCYYETSLTQSLDIQYLLVSAVDFVGINM